MKNELKIEGTVRKAESKDTHKPDVHKITGTLLIKDSEGVYSVTINGPESILEGIGPEDQVVITVKGANKSLEEA